jgi:lipopolysaccharide/colanic/teichoic acid biosynthesis glycosyltransferase/glycosyltransferase involved in cell wall biosynthesis
VKVSVIVPAHDAAQTIQECMEALLEQSLPQGEVEVIVVDDGSTDGTVTLAQAVGVRVLTQPHRGPAAARNLGASQASGDILLFTDADCAPTPTWIEEMTRPFTSTGLSASSDPEVVGVKGTYLTRQRELVARFVQVEYEDKYDRLAGQERIDFVDTYSAGYRREVFLANGGFDTTFPTASVEDQELSFRLARKGYQMVFAPQAQVFHHHDASLKEYVRRKFHIGYWKALLTRWHPERLVRDSHTPQTLKLQILLLGLAALSLLAVPLWPGSLWMATGLAGLFLASTLPFVAKAARKDAVVAIVSPFLLAVRAASLGAGFALGKARFAVVATGEGSQGLLNARQRVLKRALDVVGAVIGLVLTAPLVPLIALAIKLDSKGPVFYVQQRVGQEGRVFRMVKFRSMVNGAEEMLPEWVETSLRSQVSGLKSQVSGLRSSPACKLRRDPRVTRVGRILRRTSLDEIPQFWNVLRGEMSLVGPRPEEVRVVRLYTDWHRHRLAVKPGMTGPMQVNGRGDLPLDDRVRLEIDYIKNYSLLTDVEMLLKTVPAVLLGRGAY